MSYKHHSSSAVVTV